MEKLQNYYKKKIINFMIKKFNYTSLMQVPKIIKIVLNIGLGESGFNKKKLNIAFNNLTVISGQKPIITKSRKSIASFKIRQNNPIGCMVTLRGNKMWNFLERLIFIAIPRIRDFRGLSLNSFDGFGNYNIGIKEHIIFPEIDFDQIDNINGLNITIVSNSKIDNQIYKMLLYFNFPFKKYR
ncbi:50S ribosomal protein L5 [Enterobacteriaceae bacterium ET-AT1-13]|nr:50S ribosomal protein L5 [Enterobacteriaceae bacterium ET-AT1-13]WGS66340.1 50S ribosomal protein L5 [Enterobacteriaceae bacterium Cmel17]WMC17363.1 MAG: 50S ribosomal protein L5 [Enterobacteriaceae bacterium Cmel21]WMC17570.1 MAG: 50S ribosomal protein L5 [Enterobacteriaceae bacterium PSmelAO3-2]WMC17775.1 MAG: 50S ribosomal protein L5 [Enterobacteriaceae bacterium PSmelAO3-1]WMC17978.1 MAG: 50S ribosomal protein L5 [Enterobacteriaceae bacterium PSmelAO1]